MEDKKISIWNHDDRITDKIMRPVTVERLKDEYTTARTELEAQFPQVWDTDEMTRDFECIGFLAPYVAVKRRSDGVRGTLTFDHYPRFYFDFVEDDNG